MLCGLQDVLHRANFMDVPIEYVGTFTRHRDTPLPFYPYTTGYNDATYLVCGPHTVPDEDLSNDGTKHDIDEDV